MTGHSGLLVRGRERTNQAPGCQHPSVRAGTVTPGPPGTARRNATPSRSARGRSPDAQKGRRHDGAPSAVSVWGTGDPARPDFSEALLQAPCWGVRLGFAAVFRTGRACPTTVYRALTALPAAHPQPLGLRAGVHAELEQHGVEVTEDTARRRVVAALEVHGDQQPVAGLVPPVR